MADSLLDLDSEPVFSWKPTWSSTPSTSVALSRLLTEFPGTVQELDQIVDHAPIQFEAGFIVDSKTDETAFVAFFNARRGRNQRFWIRHPKIHFTLHATATSGSTQIVCEANDAHRQYQGYERIYIRMLTGDTLTRQVTTATYDSGAGTVALTLASPLDRNVTTTNQDRIGRLLLVRFDDDSLVQHYRARDVWETDLSFTELVNEYDI